MWRLIETWCSVLLTFLLFATSAQSAEQPRTNLIVILADDLGGKELGC